ncbi:MAG: hypothetical protein ABJZ69_09205 [Hyphomicrobiales bacterium]
MKALSYVLAFAFAAGTISPSTANHTSGRTGWNKAAGDMAVWWHLDGKIITLRNEDTGGFLRQGYGASNDAKRNVEADRGMITAPRGKGFDWVLKPAGEGYWYIVNLKTALFLTQGGSPSKFENVVNWGWHPGADDNYKWKFIQAENRSRDRGFTEGFHIVNKSKGAYLATFGGNVTSYSPDAKPEWHKKYPKRIIWRARGSELTDFERQYRAATSKTKLSLPSDNLSSLLKVTITSVKAIRTSTGQDGATKVLFAGIDLAVDIGMGIATGGASAAAKAGAKAGLKALAKKASKHVTREAVKAAAKAALRQQGEKIVKKAIKNTAKDAVNKALGDPKAKVANRAKEAMGLPGAAAAAAKVSTGILDALSSEAIFNKVYGNSNDDLEIKVSGSAIFPRGGRNDGVSISSQEELIVNRVAVFPVDRKLQIQLIEWDYASDDDSLGWFEWNAPTDPAWLEEFIKTNGVIEFDRVLIDRKSEGSLYELSLRIEPLHRYFDGEGIINRARLETEYANEGCPSTDPELCSRYIGELMGFDNWLKRPGIRDRVLETYAKHCEHPTGARKLECTAIPDPLRATCNAGVQSSCQRIDKINGAASRFVNLRIWEGNCGLNNGDAELNCIKLGTAFLEGAPYEGPVGNQSRFQFATGRLYEFCEAGSEASCRMTEAVSQKLCAYFDDTGCFYRGRVDEFGKTGGKDVSAALKWYNTGCQFQGGTSCAAIAQFGQANAQVASLGNALGLYEPAERQAALGCSYGSSFACEIQTDIQTAIQAEKAKPYYKCSVLDDPTSCAAAGQEYLKVKNYSAARNAFQQGCIRSFSAIGDGPSCYGFAKILGDHAAEFAPVDDPDPNAAPKDVRETQLSIFERGCEAKHPESCIETSKILSSDTFAKKDVNKAYELMQDICSQALNNTGVSLGRELCEERNRVFDLRPETQNTNSCSAGNAKACITLGTENMGQYLYKDVPVESQYSLPFHVPGIDKARVNYSQACELNSGEGCLLHGNLENLYALREINILTIPPGENILDARRSEVFAAKAAYEKGCKLNNADACAGLQRMLSNPIYGLEGANNNVAQTPNNQPTRNNQNSNTQNSGNQSGNAPAPTSTPTPTNNNGPAQLVIQSGEGCSRRGQVVSTSGAAGSLTFNNIGNHRLFVYWLDESGTDTDYGRSGNPLLAVEPGDTQTIDTAVGFAYSILSVVNGQTECVGVAEISAVETTVLMSRDVVPTNNVAGRTAPRNPNNNVANNNQSNTNNSGQSGSRQQQPQQEQLALSAGLGCERRGSVVSSRSGENADVLFSNTGTEPLYVYWLDENGSENDYDYSGNPLAIVEAGQSHTEAAEIGFAYSVFSIVDDQLACVGLAEISAADTLISMAGDSQSANDNLADQSGNDQYENDQIADNQDDTDYQNDNSATAEVSLGDGYGCDMRGSVVSSSTDEGASLTFDNYGSDTLYVYWIGEDGTDTDYNYSGNPLAAIGPGETQDVDGAVGSFYSVYTVVDGQTQCVGMMEVTSSSVYVQMSGDSISQYSGSTNDNQQDYQEDNQVADNQDNNDYQNENSAPVDVSLEGGYGCEMRGSVVSNNTGEGANLTFNNYGSDTLYVYWIGEDGTDTDYNYSGNPLAAIGPGETQDVDGAVGSFYSVYTVVDGQAQCVGMTEVTSDSVYVQMSGDSIAQNPGDTNDNQQDYQNDNQVADNQNDTDYQNDNSAPVDVSLEGGYGCEMRGSVVSNNTGEGANLTFNNYGSDTLYVYWIGEDGTDTDYNYSGSPLAAIGPGETQDVDGAVGSFYSVYTVVDGQAQCVGMTEVTSSSVYVQMSGDSIAQNSGYANDNQQDDQTQYQDQQSTDYDNQDQSEYNDQDQSGYADQNAGQTAQAGQGCELRGQVASYNSGEPATASFYNSGNDVLYVYWLDESGQENDYSGTGNPLLAIGAGESQSVDAYIGYAFSMFSESGVCVGVDEVTEVDSVFDVSGLY